MNIAQREIQNHDNRTFKYVVGKTLESSISSYVLYEFTFINQNDKQNIGKNYPDKHLKCTLRWVYAVSGWIT